MGEPFRVPYGFALGRANAFQFTFGPTESGTAGCWNKCRTTEDVTKGVLFFTDNTAATTISALTCNSYSSNTSNQTGRIIRIMFLDTATQLSQAGNIVLAGTGNFGATGVAPLFIDLMQAKGKWYEVARSPQTTQDYVSLNMSGTTDQSVPADGVSSVFVTQTSTTTTMVSISGGYIGQQLTVVFLNTAGSTVTLTTAGNLMFQNTAGVVVRATGGAFSFVKVSTAATKAWYMIAGNSYKLN